MFSPGVLNISGKLIEDETFDFDLPVTPINRGRDDKLNLSAHYNSTEEDGVALLGLAEHKGKDIVQADIKQECEEKSSIKPLSPLTSEQQAELFKEAHTLLYHLNKFSDKESTSSSNESPLSSKAFEKTGNNSVFSPLEKDLKINLAEKPLEDLKQNGENKTNETTDKLSSSSPPKNCTDGLESNHFCLADDNNYTNIDDLGKDVPKFSLSPKFFSPDVKHSEALSFQTKKQSDDLKSPLGKEQLLPSPALNTNSIKKLVSENNVSNKAMKSNELIKLDSPIIQLAKEVEEIGEAKKKLDISDEFDFVVNDNNSISQEDQVSDNTVKSSRQITNNSASIDFSESGKCNEVFVEAKNVLDDKSSACSDKNDNSLTLITFESPRDVCKESDEKQKYCEDKICSLLNNNDKPDNLITPLSPCSPFDESIEKPRKIHESLIDDSNLVVDINFRLLVENKLHANVKRKLCDTSFSSTVTNDTDLNDNMSEYSPSVCHRSLRSESSLTSSPSISLQSDINPSFTISSPENPLPNDLSAVLPKPKLKADNNGIVKFGASRSSLRIPSTTSKKVASASPVIKQPSKVLKSSDINIKSIKISPTKRQKIVSEEKVRAPLQSNRRSLANPAIIKRSTHEVPKRSGLKPPKSILNSTIQILPNRNLCSGFKKPEARGAIPKALKAPQTKANPTVSGIKSFIKMPTSVNQKAVTTLPQESGTVVTPAVKPKTSSLDQPRKTVAATRLKTDRQAPKSGLKTPCPVKALEPISKFSTSVRNSAAAKPVPTSVKTPEVTPSRPVNAVQPKTFAVPEQQPSYPETPNRKNRSCFDPSEKRSET